MWAAFATALGGNMGGWDFNIRGGTGKDDSQVGSWIPYWSRNAYGGSDLNESVNWEEKKSARGHSDRQEGWSACV